MSRAPMARGGHVKRPAEAQALLRPCPVCGQQPGQRCLDLRRLDNPRSWQQTIARVHAARRTP